MIIKRPPKVMIVKRVSVDITPKLVEDFWRYFQNIYGTRVVQKATAKEMRAAGWFLDRLGTMDRKTFLANYTTTIGKKIYTPFIIGEPNDKWSLLAQLITCVHEHVHVDQSKRHGFARYAYRYLFSTAKRSMYEAEAYRSNMEMYFWRNGRLPSVKKLAAKLKNYGCRSVDIRAVEKYLAASAMAVKQGAVINRASQIGIRWLERNSPGL